MGVTSLLMLELDEPLADLFGECGLGLVERGIEFLRLGRESRLDLRPIAGTGGFKYLGVTFAIGWKIVTRLLTCRTS